MAAQSPKDVHMLFAEYFSAGDLDRLLSLYESDAAFVPRTGAVVNGQVQIRETLASFLELKGEMELQVRRTVRADDLALLLSDWTIYRASPSEREVESSGRTADVVRRQEDGRWLIVIDNPHCTGDLS